MPVAKVSNSRYVHSQQPPVLTMFRPLWCCRYGVPLNFIVLIIRVRRAGWTRGIVRECEIATLP